MKKIAILSLLFFCAQGINAQTSMTFHLVNGTVLGFNADSIVGIGFMGNPTQSRQYLFKLYPDTGWGTGIPSEFPLGIRDSMWFSGTSSSLMLDVAQWFDAGFAGLIGTYNIQKIDSLTVAPRFPEPLDTNYNVVEIPKEYDTMVPSPGRFYGPLWIGNRIYVSRPVTFFDIDSNFNVIGDSNTATFYPVFLSNNVGGTRLLTTAGTHYISLALYEVQMDSGNQTIRIDTETDISSARYYGNGDDSIIFYTYGGSSGAGYYLFDRVTGNEKLILNYESELGPWEMVNGFDISPDMKKLLIPVVRNNKLPLVFEYDMTTGISDTLNIQFDSQYVRPCLWLRYNHDGSEILYDNYPNYSFWPQDPAGNWSEIGIIDRATLTTKRLRTNPTDIYEGISLMPEWSPDETKIVYGCGGLFDDGTVEGNYRVCILTTLQ